MKQCGTGWMTFDDEYLICPEDSNLLDAAPVHEVADALEPVTLPSPEGMLESAAPRHVDKFKLVSSSRATLLTSHFEIVVK